MLGTRHSALQPTQSRRCVAILGSCVLLAPKAISLICKAVVYPEHVSLAVAAAPSQPRAEPEAPFCSAQESQCCPESNNPAGHPPWNKPCYPCLPNGSPDTEKLSDLPKVTPRSLWPIPVPLGSIHCLTHTPAPLFHVVTRQKLKSR